MFGEMKKFRLKNVENEVGMFGNVRKLTFWR